MRVFLAMALASFALGGAAQAEDLADDCMRPVPIDAALLRDVKEYNLTGFAGAGQTPAFIAGGLSPMRENAGDLYGAVLFLRAADGRWSAVLPKQGEGEVGVYRATNSDALVFVTMIQTEGPGPSWTVVTLRGGAGKCVSVPFPDDLNKPTYNLEFLELTDFDIGANGRGELIGVSRAEGRADWWYAYRTRNGGLTWERPQRLRRQRAARGGLYEQVVDAPAPAALAAELEAYAAGR
ncbi:MAG: hypothetical protein JNJ73_01605 [Hyphomonadaceae bacterium]|nr:hypothetical protein [Hyphomonadaceae bacterium]